MEKEPIGLVPANKIMTEILEIFETATAGDFAIYDDLLKQIANKANKVVELYNTKGQ